MKNCKSTNHPSGLLRSHANFQPDTCKTDGDVGPQRNIQRDL